jgi:glycogen debranching enzyme
MTGYNVVNSPHLEAALELDNALLEFSRNLEKLGLATELKEWDDLLKIMNHLENKIIPSLNLWQYYVIDVESEKSRFTKAWSSAKSSKSSQIPEDLASLSREDLIQLFAGRCMIKGWSNLGSRYHAKVADMDLAVAFVAKLLGSSDKSAEEATQALGQILNDLNVARYALYNDDVKAILENTKGRIDYTRLAGHGPKMGKITEKYACPMKHPECSY